MLNFGTNFEKTGIFVNRFIKQILKLGQKKLLTINFLRKVIWESEKNLKTLPKLARKFLSKLE